jgi:hypothetical protein
MILIPQSLDAKANKPTERTQGQTKSTDTRHFASGTSFCAINGLAVTDR